MPKKKEEKCNLNLLYNEKESPIKKKQNLFVCVARKYDLCK